MGCQASPLPGATNGYCLPTCNDDAACPSGTKCDLGSGMCSASAKGSASEIGNARKETADGGVVAPVCSSGVLAASGSGATVTSYCSALCTVGVTPSCGWTGLGTKANAVCNVVEGINTFSAGNQGKCSRLCDCDSDCDAPLRCHTLKAEFAKDLGRAGQCLAGDTNIVACDGGLPVDAGDAGITDAANDG